MRIVCVDNKNCKNITVGKIYKVKKVYQYGLKIKNDNDESVFLSE